MLERLARFVIAAPRRVLIGALLLAVAAAIFGIPVSKHLAAGGQQDPNSQSQRVARILTEKFKISDQSLVFVISSDQGAKSPAARQAAANVERTLHESSSVLNLTSAWTAPPEAAGELFSKDGKAGLVVAGITGGENDAQKNAAPLIKNLTGDHDGVSVKAGGVAALYKDITAQTDHDLLVMEMIAVPLSFVALVWIFGGLNAALLPLSIGVFAIFGSMSILRLLSTVTDVSVFALNLTTAMGLAMAIDYSLLIISRYREEVSSGLPRDEALVVTMRTAGRTVLFSAITLALALSALVLFPMYFLKSFAYAGVAVVFFSAAAALIIVPAVVALLGDRIDALDARKLIRRLLGRPEPTPKDVVDTFWYRNTKKVMRHAFPVSIVIVVVLILLGLPFLNVKLGFPDDRVLPVSAATRQVGDEMRANFANDSATNLSVVADGVGSVAPSEIDRFAAELSAAPDVKAVSAPDGTYVHGKKQAPPTAATGIKDGTALFTVQTAAVPYTPAADRQLDALHAIKGPGGVATLIGGGAQLDRDAVDALMGKLPWVLAIIAVVTFVLLFLLTGSVVLPLKALVLNVLSLTATFGALVWIFQEGHLHGFGTAVTGVTVSSMPILLFCIAFGLSMDYEVFLISRIHEYWKDSARTRADSDEAVALGVARTGRVVTAAALIMAIAFAALIAAQVSFMRMFGTGLTIAILVDATIVRMLLVPSFMRILGRANWWAPKPLVRLHERFGISEESHAASGVAGG